MLLWRSRSEVNEAIDELADELESVDDSTTSMKRRNALLNRLAALVWATGAAQEISVEDPDFQAVLKRLRAAAEKRMGG